MGHLRLSAYSCCPWALLRSELSIAVFCTSNLIHDDVGDEGVQRDATGPRLAFRKASAWFEFIVIVFCALNAIDDSACFVNFCLSAYYRFPETGVRIDFYHVLWIK